MLNIDASLESNAYTKKTVKSKDDMLHQALLSLLILCEEMLFVPHLGVPSEVYQNLPDPVLSDKEEGHYKSFDEV